MPEVRSGGWLVRTADTGSEVVPVGDAVGHGEGDDCACLPYVEHVPCTDGTSGWMVVHHAWDGRP